MNQIYTPDMWAVLKITIPHNDKPFYKVFATWYGGYTQGDMWKLNSGITAVKLEDNCLIFDGYSGSCYSCVIGSYGTSGYSQNVLNSIIHESGEFGAKIELMPHETDFLSLDYSGVNY